MATHRERLADVRETDDSGSVLPPDLAAGPTVDVWCPPDVAIPPWMDDPAGRRQVRTARAQQEWSAAGIAWSRQQGLGDRGWRAMLPPDVAYATSALGRSHARHGDYRPPWEADQIRKSKPKENR